LKNDLVRLSAFVPLLVLSTGHGQGTASVEIWCDTQFEDVSPYLFGSGDEMDEDFVPLPGLSAMIGQTGVPMLRMGGIANEYYDWEGNGFGGVRYIDLVDTLIITQNALTSMDDFLQMCEELQIEPILSVNFQINDPGKAARLVEYCNGDETTPMGQIRAQRGHPQPYSVQYWEIGNEPDITGLQLSAGGYTQTMYRHFGIPFDQWHWSDSSFASPEQYAQLADTYADAMRAGSPMPLQIATISLSANQTWLQQTIETCGENTDWVDIHYYPCISWEQTPPDTADYIEWLRCLDDGPMALENWYETMVAAVAYYNGGIPIPVCIMEYNALVLYSDQIWWNYIDGLFVADCMGHLARAGCPMGGVYSIFEGSPGDPYTSFGMLRGDTLSMRATAWVVKLYTDNLTGTMVEAQSDAAGAGYGLEVHASLREDGMLCVMGINKLLDQPVDAEITLNGYVSSGYASVSNITNDATLEAPYNGTTGIQIQQGIWGSATSFEYTFPKASVTCLMIHPEGSGAPSDPTDGFSLNVSPLPAENILRIGVELPEPAGVQIMLYDCSGRLQTNMMNEFLPAGSHRLLWNRDETPSGMYLIRVFVEGAPVAGAKTVLI